MTHDNSGARAPEIDDEDDPEIRMVVDIIFGDPDKLRRLRNIATELQNSKLVDHTIRSDSDRQTTDDDPDAQP